MRIDPRQMALELREAFDQVRPEGPFHGSAPGVEVTVTSDGEIADLHFAEAVYRVTHSDDLSRAIMAAHRQARTAALTAHRKAIDEMLTDRETESRWETT